MRRTTLGAIVLIVALAVVGCGDGSGSGDDPGDGSLSLPERDGAAPTGTPVDPLTDLADPLPTETADDVVDEPVEPTPTRTTGTVGEIDLSGPWTIHVGLLGLDCPADVVQEGSRLEIGLDCIGIVSTLGGTVEADGTFRVRGGLPPLCPGLEISGESADGERLTGVAICEGLGLASPIEGWRGHPTATPVPPTATPFPTPGDVPEDFDLNGTWTVSVPLLGLDCLADVVHEGSDLRIGALCLGLPLDLVGTVEKGGAFSMAGSLEPFCPVLQVDGYVSADAMNLYGNAACEGLGLVTRIEAKRGGKAPAIPTSTPTPTPFPPGTPGEFDLNGPWIVTVPLLAIDCPAAIEHDGERVFFELSCLGVSASMEAVFDESGLMSGSGSLPPLCTHFDFSARVNSVGTHISGTATCDELGLAAPFEARRGGDGPEATATPTATPIPRPTLERPDGVVDLTGEWTIIVPTLGFTCVAFIEQEGSDFTSDFSCAGFAATLDGTVGEDGEVTAAGSLDPICPDLVLDAIVSADAAEMTGMAVCSGAAFEFDGVRLR